MLRKILDRSPLLKAGEETAEEADSGEGPLSGGDSTLPCSSEDVSAELSEESPDWLISSVLETGRKLSLEISAPTSELEAVGAAEAVEVAPSAGLTSGIFISENSA